MRLNLELDKYMNIAGGQFCDESGCVDEYYIQFEDADLEMSSETLKKLAIDAINHLMVNGHSFDFFFTDMGQFVFRESNANNKGESNDKADI